MPFVSPNRHSTDAYTNDPNTPNSARGIPGTSPENDRQARQDKYHRGMLNDPLLMGRDVGNMQFLISNFINRPYRFFFSNLLLSDDQILRGNDLNFTFTTQRIDREFLSDVLVVSRGQIAPVNMTNSGTDSYARVCVAPASILIQHIKVPNDEGLVGFSTAVPSAYPRIEGLSGRPSNFSWSTHTENVDYQLSYDFPGGESISMNVFRDEDATHLHSENIIHFYADGSRSSDPGQHRISDSGETNHLVLDASHYAPFMYVFF